MKNKIKYIVLILVLCLGLSVPVSAKASTMVYDDADLLTDSEEERLNKKLESISDEYVTEIVVVTVESTGGVNVNKYINNLYDREGFGYGSNHDGVMLLLCMDTRDYRILTNGLADAAIGDSGIDDIGDAIVSDLSSGDYYDAFDEYADQCDYYLNKHINNPFDFKNALIFSVAAGFVVALIVVLVLKAQLKSVRRQYYAREYVKSGSMHVTESKDFYLYRKVTSTRRQSSSSSGSGSSRSVGGGKF